MTTSPAISEQLQSITIGRPLEQMSIDIMNITRSELDKLVRWDEPNLGYLTLFVPLISREIDFVLFAGEETASEVTDKTTATINDVLALRPDDLGRIKELLWEECNFAFQVADYGVELEDGETSLDAHLREFRLSGPDDAFDRSDFREIHIADEFAGRYAEIKVDTGSDNYISIIVKNGSIIDFADDGTYLGWCDDDEKKSHKARKKVLEG
jgi:hypothetical protein